MDKVFRARLTSDKSKIIAQADSLPELWPRLALLLIEAEIDGELTAMGAVLEITYEDD